MAREVKHRYVDPLDAVWIAAAEAIGLRVSRTPHAFASTDGEGRLLVGTPETLDADDCLAQMILHELCHSLVEGPSSLGREDWGLDNQTDRDLVREHACLRLQAALTAPWGLRRVLAPTTEHRAYYDALPEDPLAPRRDPASIAARLGRTRAGAPPWSPHLPRALEATATIARSAASVSVPDTVLRPSVPVPVPVPAAVPSLLTLVDPPAPKHPLGFSVRASGGTCATCAWRFSGGRGRAVDRCRQAEGARVDPAWPACDHYEDDAEVECTRCGACCREAYGAVIVSSRDPVATRHPDLLHRDGRTLLVRRDGDRCAALTGGAGPDDGYLCRIYAERPRTCRDFTRLGEHCLTARRRVGLS